ncbi:MAG: hypothetical protein ABJ205_05870 [Erythrobacter sp.]|uniref:Acg family FMN-binding oxidoreductase n=1 Tax=Erythrobacter sp. TaxID=1042 RepID=UPI003267CC5A
MNRRMVFAAGLGGTGLVAVGGIWRVTRMPDGAFEPWVAAGNEVQDVRLDAFRHAILAPNPHNRQPWLIELVGQDEAIVSCDLEKRLPVTDPFDRQITIGFGAFLEVARIAAAQRGIAIEVDLFPQGEAQPRLDRTPVARLRFGGQEIANPDPLFDAIVHRRSNKEAYDTARVVEPALLDDILKSGGEGTAQSARIGPIKDEILSSINAELATRDAYMESVDLMRIGHEEVAANPDGIDLTGPMIEAGIVTGQISREQLADMQSNAYKIGVEQTNETHGSVPSLIWIKTPSNTRADQIEAGRQYVRANLRATQLGLSMHPMSQSLQEYSEVADSCRAVHELLGASGEERIQMLARVGYGPRTGPSPRWPIVTFVIPQTS